MVQLDQFSESKMATSQRDFGQYLTFDIEQYHILWVVEGGESISDVSFTIRSPESNMATNISSKIG